MTDKNRNHRPDRQERLRDMLRTDLDSPEEADALLGVVQRLERWPAPKPTREATSQLVQALIPAMPCRAEPRLAGLRRRAAEWWPLLLLRAQLRVVRQDIWMASGLVMALGILVTLASATTNRPEETLPLVWIAPLVTAIGVAYLYGPDTELPLEIELATPVSRRIVLIARLTLVFGFDLGLALAGSIALVAFQSGVSLWPLVVAWLAPMAFLSALAFLVSVVFIDPMAGTLLSLALWISQTFVRFWRVPLSLPDVMTADARPWLMLLAMIMGAVALWIAGRDERVFRNLA